jgi:hypothetical protein
MIKTPTTERKNMGFRIGRRVGKFYVSTGEGGTRVSTKVGEYTVSNWIPNKRGSKKVESEYIGEVATDAENMATNTQIWWNLFLTFVLFFCVWITGEFLVPLGVLLVVQAVGAGYIWWNVESEHKWFYWFFPFVILFVTPLAWFWWIILLGVCYGIS